MSRSEKNLNRWQFGIRELLHATAYACIIAGSFRIDASVGFFVTTILAAMIGGGLLRRDGEGALKANAATGSMIGGALGCAGQFALVLTWEELFTQNYPDRFFIYFVYLILLIGLGIGLGGIVGLLVWLSWSVLVVWCLAIHDLKRFLFRADQRPM